MTGGKLLPKAGHWMNIVKVTFGFMMLTVAILFVERIIIHPLTDLLWAGVGLALYVQVSAMAHNKAYSTAWYSPCYQVCILSRNWQWLLCISHHRVN